MVDISMPDVLYLNTNNLPSYSQGLYQNKDHLEIPRNSVYMLSSYQTEWPYSDKFISIIRDDNGRYHLVNQSLSMPCLQLNPLKFENMLQKQN